MVNAKAMEFESVFVIVIVIAGGFCDYVDDGVCYDGRLYHFR